ncbi:MAG: exodeoxyribonuclease VII large subunit [Erysipelotrichaceae bacterium]|nr:exodeoxyribonuclease VII large subunit [Erysipelotrichaceae bacterium]
MQQISVSSLVRYLKNRLDTDDNLQNIYVSGEISNYHRHFSGHLYFTLKDEKAAISCVMFKSAAASLKFEPKTGDKVVVYANTSVFETSGQLQLYVKKISLDGAGDLYAQYEALKKKMAAEGKFEESHKKILEKEFPEMIAVLVGDRSAAMSDIKTAFARRWPLCEVDYYPVLVQGNDAPADIIRNLKEADEKNYDAIILARGGGSFEDLFCFNDEELVNTIYELKTFLISGIGHEQDFTLTDFVADQRAATPTAAVELITPDIADIREVINEYAYSLTDSMEAIMAENRIRFDLLTSKLMNYQNILKNIYARIDACTESLKHSLYHNITVYRQEIAYGLDKISSELNFRLNNERLTFKRLNTLLEAYSSENVLKRGYTLVVQDDKVVKSRKELQQKEFDVRFADGTITAIERH